MSLSTAATLTLDRLQYTVQLRAVTAELSLLPGVNQAEVLIAPGVEVSARPGDRAALELDGGEGAATVITGTVQRLERSAAGTAVSIVDGGAALAAIRPNTTYSGLPAAQIVTDLARKADVRTGLVVAPLPTAAFVAQPTRTAAQHIADLATRANGFAAISGEGELTVTPWPSGTPTVALRRTRELLALAVSAHTPAPELVAVGGGGSSAAQSPDAWVMSTDPVGSGGEPDATRAWTTDAVLRTTSAVESANKGLSARRGAASRRMLAQCWLQPALRPGDLLQIQDTASSDEAGPWLLVSVSHQLTPGSATTRLVGVSGGDPGDLLGGAAAIGGLL